MREKGAVRHDDSIDCLAQGVKYFTDAFGISAQQQINLRKMEDWNDMLQAFVEDPQAMTNHLVLGMNIKQRNKLEATGGGGGGKTLRPYLDLVNDTLIQGEGWTSCTGVASAALLY